MADEQHRLKVGVVGLGSMGYGMAQSALRGGHLVWGQDINPDQVARLRAEGGQQNALNVAAPELDALVVVVLNAAQTEQVLLGQEGLVPRMRPGAVVISCATVAPDFARAMEQACTAQGIHYLDAPISGGSVKAAEGKLTVMASGKAAAFDAARPVLGSLAQKVFELGDTAGPASAMKATNQMLAGVHIAVMAEALTFGMTQGIAPETFLEVISQCAGTSWMLENRAPHIVSGDYAPRSSVAIWPKDLGIVLDIARQAEFAAPITEAALQQYLTAVEMGLAGQDDAAVAKVYARDAGLALPGSKG